MGATHHPCGGSQCLPQRLGCRELKPTTGDGGENEKVGLHAYELPGDFCEGRRSVTVHVGENVKAEWENVAATVLRQEILEHMGYSECRASGEGTLTTPKETVPRLKCLTL